MNWIFEPAAVFAGLRLVSPDETIELTGYFGAEPERVQSCLVSSLWNDCPPSRGSRQRSSILLANRAAIQGNDKNSAKCPPEGGSIIVVSPLTKFQAVGTIEVIFPQDQPEQSQAVKFLLWFGLALTLYATNLANTVKACRQPWKRQGAPTKTPTGNPASDP